MSRYQIEFVSLLGSVTCSGLHFLSRRSILVSTIMCGARKNCKSGISNKWCCQPELLAGASSFQLPRKSGAKTFSRSPAPARKGSRGKAIIDSSNGMTMNDLDSEKKGRGNIIPENLGS